MLISVACVVLAWGMRYLLDPWLEDRIPYATFFAAVAIAAWIGGWRTALVASVLGLMVAWYFFVPTRTSFALPNLGHGLGLGMYIIVCVAFASFGEAMRHARKQAEMRSENLRVTISSIGDAVITTDAQSRVTFLNGVAEELTGWRSTEAQGTLLDDVFRIVNERTRAKAENPAHKAITQGRIVGLANHTILIAKDGSEHPIEDSAAPIRSDEGNIDGCVLVFRDVGEARAVQRAMAESEARKAAILRTALDAIITIDHRGRVIEFNPSAERIFGYKQAEVVGRDMAELIVPPALRERYRAGMARHLGTGASNVLGKRLELQAMRADGSAFPVEVAIARIDTEGDPLFTAYLRDITAQRKAQEGMARLAALVGSSSDAIISKNLDTTITSWNSGAELLFGYTAEEAIGKPITLLIPPDRMDEEPGILERIRRGERIEHYETVRRRKDGTLVEVSLGVSPILDERGRVIGASKIARDISQQMRERRELGRTAEELRKADRRKDEFLATLAHELRGPLAPLSNALQLLEIAPDDPQTAERARTMMGRQVEQMVRLIDDLMDLSRISRGAIELRKSTVDLKTIVQRSVEAARPLIIQQGHELKMELDEGPLWVEGDPARLVQIYSNLLNNAAKYTDPGGRITVRGHAVGDHVVIDVVDNGIGIAPDKLDKVFDMFAQLEPAGRRTREGLGIGLHIVRRLVDMHGSRLQAVSEGRGKGSTFTVTMPLAKKPVDAADKGPQPKALAPLPVLITDDNVEAAVTLGMLVRAMGNPVEVAHDAEDAVGRTKQFKPALIFMDIGMPGIDGYEACRRLRSLPDGGRIYIVALTGWGQDGDRQRALTAGFDEHLVKPLTREGLSAALEAAHLKQRT